MTLTPFVSTHFRSRSSWIGITPGRVYRILEWEKEPHKLLSSLKATIYFRDDRGNRRMWRLTHEVFKELEEASYTVHLEKILGE